MPGPSEPVGTNRARLLVALVVPDPAATEIDGLRRAFASRDLGRIPPHITLVAPINVRAAPFEIDEHLHQVAQRFSAPHVRLGPAATFAPESPVLYLSVGGELEALQQALAMGPFQSPVNRSQRRFVAHVTVTSRATEEVVHAGVLALASYRQEVVFDRLTLFEQDEEEERRPWREIGDYRFGEPAHTGTGGRELTFRVAHQLSIEESDFLLRARTSANIENLIDAAETGVLIVVSSAGETLGILRATSRGEALELRELVVAPGHDHEGIASQLLRFLERYGQEQHHLGIHAWVGEEEAAILLEHGYRRLASDESGRSWLKRAL